MATHPKSLDGLSLPDKATLREFEFLNVNTAIANAVLALEYIPTKKGKETVTRGEMASYMKGVLEEQQQVWKGRKKETSETTCRSSKRTLLKLPSLTLITSQKNSSLNWTYYLKP